MQKLTAILLTLTMLLSLCVPAIADESHDISGEVFTCYNAGEENGALSLFFLDGVTDLPYVEANSLCGLLDTFIGRTAASFTMEAEGPVLTITRHQADSLSDGVWATFDFGKSEIRFIDYNLFIMRPNASTLLDTTAVNYFNEEGQPAVLQKLDKGTFDRYGDELVLPLADYGIELVYQPIEDGLYLIPLQTINDFLLAPNCGNSLFYNGQILILGSNIEPDDALYYAAPTGERSEALTKFGYGELCMMLDYLYGLKPVHAIDSFAQLFDEVGFDEHLKGPEVRQADGAIYRLITDYLDDGHSAWHAFSYLAGNLDYKAPEGPSEAKYWNQLAMYEGARKKFFPDGVPDYEEFGNTAYITFDAFNLPDMDAERYYRTEDVMSFDDTDTIGLIMKAHAMITRKDSPIENVVLDLSCNGGGAVDTALFVVAWFLGEANIGIKDTMTGALCASTYRCDANRDREFDERDTVEDKNLFILTSPVGFSCGNYVPCAFKESGRVTVLGRTSGGGSCVVLNASSAWGTSFRLSGSRRISFLKNGAYYDVDRGADPDVVITSPEQFYDRPALTDFINSLY